MNSYKTVQLSDLLSLYGNSNDKGFQQKFQSMEEFASLSSSVTEQLTGKFYKHQTLTHRYLSHYDNLLVLSETGTGKTCEIAGFLEMTRRAFLASETNIRDEGLAHFTKVIILVRNDTLKKEMKNQIMCKCTSGNYITENVINARDDSSQKSAVTIALKNAGYVIMTYSKAAGMVYKKAQQLGGDRPVPLNSPYLIKEVQEMFNDSVIWVDEAHNLFADLDGEPSVEEGKNLSKDETYQALHLILHKAQRIKRILSTATPMINNTSELAALLNLILPENGKVPPGFSPYNLSREERQAFFPTLANESEEEFRRHTIDELNQAFRGQIPEDYDFVDATLPQLEPWVRGKINYVRAADTGARPIYNGVRIDYIQDIGNREYQSQVIVYPSIMSSFQYQSYLRAVDSDRKGKSLSGAQIQTTNAVFPDGGYGSGTSQVTRAQGLGGNVITDIKKVGAEKSYFGGSELDRRANENFRAAIGDVRKGNISRAEVINNIRKLSAKYASICELVLSKPGICFVYDEIVAGSGLNFLAACLESLGLQRFEERTSIFVSNEGYGVKPLCSSSNTSNREIRRTFPKSSGDVPPRFAILTQESVEISDVILEAINCRENRNGEYVKIILCSRIAKEGININNVVQIHMASSSWNESSNLQAKSRGLRATSHAELLEDLRKSGITTRPTVDVMMYNHVALPPFVDLERVIQRGVILPDEFCVRSLDGQYLLDSQGRRRLMVDINAFLTSERKDISIKTVMRKLKQISISCNIHYNRNVRDTDIDYSAACDYDICKYACFDPPTAREDITSENFNLLYSRDLVEAAKNRIIHFIKTYNDHFSFDELQISLHQFRPIHLMFALEEIISNKTEILDRFGYVCFLTEDRGSFYVTRTYPDRPGHYDMYYYSQGLIAVEKQSLKDINLNAEQGISLEVIQELRKMDPDSQDFSLFLHSLPNIVQVSILEEAAFHHSQGDRSKYTLKILEYFYSWFIYSFNRPDTSLKEAAKEFARIKSGRRLEGKKKIENIFNKERTRTVIEEKNTPLVYVHILYGQGESMNKFSTISRFNKADGVLRILETDKPEVGWRFIESNAERQVYNEMLQLRLNKKKEPYESHEVYGIIAPDNIFRIRDRTRENNESNDGRSFCRGIVCSTYGTLAETYDLFYRVGYYPPGYDNTLPIEQIVEELQGWGRRAETWKGIDFTNLDFVRFVYFWEKVDTTKSRKCEGLMEFLQQKGLIMNVFPV